VGEKKKRRIRIEEGKGGGYDAMMVIVVAWW